MFHGYQMIQKTNADKQPTMPYTRVCEDGKTNHMSELSDSECSQGQVPDGIFSDSEMSE